MGLESGKPRQSDNLKTRIEYFDRNDSLTEPLQAVKRVTTDYDENGHPIRTFVELNSMGFQAEQLK